VPYSQFHWELGNSGDGNPSSIANDGDNDFFALNNKRQVFLT
jgi:hypothetical protein